MDFDFLDSEEALRRIVTDLEEFLTCFQSRQAFVQLIVTTFSLSSSLPWPYVLLTLAAVVTFTFSTSSLLCSFLLLLILLLNIVSSLWNSIQKQKEIKARLLWCITVLKDAYDNSEFSDCLKLAGFLQELRSCHTASIIKSPSHSISHVFRKWHDRRDEAVPIPTSLLARGDTVLLWPGQESPAKAECKLDQCCALEVGQIYESTMTKQCMFHDENDEISDHKFSVIESPIIEEMKLCLSAFLPDNDVMKLPPLLLQRQKTFLLRFFLKFIIPIVLVITYITSACRYLLLPQETPIHGIYNITYNKTMYIVSGGTDDLTEDRLYEAFLKIPVLLYLPFLPIILPLIMILLVAVGEAKTICIVTQDKDDTDFEVIATPTTLSSQMFLKSQMSESSSWHRIFPKVLWGCDGTILPQNAGLFLSLGSLTVLCCIDKEGILSWFNPVAERVFFFQHSSATKTGDTATNSETPYDKNAPARVSKTSEFSQRKKKYNSETLTLSQDSHNPNQIQFDDINWEQHLSSLKPIGLDILLNLCSCPMDQNWMTLNDSEALLDSQIQGKLEMLQGNLICYEEKLTSIAHNANCLVSNVEISQMGLCSLAELIGFSTNIRAAYGIEQRFTAYREPSAAHWTERSSRTAESSSNNGPSTHRSTLQQKGNIQSIPQLSGIVINNTLGEVQVLVHGSGDLVIEHCASAWNGVEIIHLSELDKKRAVDFYQRSSVAGQCVAFAFMPLLSEESEDCSSSPKFENPKLINLSRETWSNTLFPSSRDHKDLLTNLIFLGMCTLQYQAKFNVCRLVETLERACIRFVHFSPDNEVRSRVFAEKMGLEAGWNCHISLVPGSDKSSSQDSRHNIYQKSENSKSRTSSECGTQKLRRSLDEEEEDVSNSSSHLLEQLSPNTRSESSTSDSLFNVSNRAKLPRGIENIVPHIENVDNVPLLVPLFTDATPQTSQKMIKIMQDYGEVVCCVGSSECIRNMSVFSQANVSIAVKPSVHSVQDKRESSLHNFSPIDSKKHSGNPTKESAISNHIALKTARKLHSFPCSVLLHNENNLNIISAMITQARHFLYLMRISIIFLLKSQIMLALLQLISYLLLLPVPFSPLTIFWISFVALPFLSASLLGSPLDEDIMTWANQKALPKEWPITQFMLKQSAKRFLVKYLPSCFVLIIAYILSLHSSCVDIKSSLEPKPIEINANSNVIYNASSVEQFIRTESISVQCYPLFTVTVIGDNATTLQISIWNISTEMSRRLHTVQMVISCFLIVYFCTISSGYVQRWKRFINHPPYVNRVWCIVLPSLIICQVIGSTLSIYFYQGVDKLNLDVIFPNLKTTSNLLNFGLYQAFVWTILLVWPVPCTIVNELWKLREIRMWERSQKRARLEFGTKLGMNSPF